MAQVNKPILASIFAGAKLSNGTPLVPDDTINQAEFEKQYNANKLTWDKAIAYLSETNLDEIALGRHDITAGDSAYAIIAEGPTKPIDQVKWESHLKYIDIQCVISGAEQMQLAPVGGMVVTEPYNEAKDVIKYEGEGVLHHAPAGKVFIFFPDDAHRPSIRVDGFDTNRKIVIKIAAAY